MNGIVRLSPVAWTIWNRTIVLFSLNVMANLLSFEYLRASESPTT